MALSQADTNKAALRWGLEAGGYGDISTDGTFVAPTLTDLRYTSESLNYDKKVIQSNEIRNDRNILDHIEVGADVSGDVSGELSYATYDTWFKVLLMPDEASAGNGTDPIAATTTGFTLTSTTRFAVTNATTITDSSSGFITAGMVKGMIIKVSGWATAANNGYFTLATVAAGSITISEGGMSAEGAGPSVTIKGRMMRNGVGLVLGVPPSNLPSMILEKDFADIGSTFQHFTGLRINQLQLNITTQQIVTATWSFMGKNMKGTTATIGSGAPTAANSNTIMNATSNVGSIKEGGSSADFYIKSLQLTLKNNLRQREVVGSKFPVEQGTGFFQCEGKMEVYFKNATLYNKLINHTATALQFRLTDASSNVMIITIPKIRILKGAPLISGGNADVMVPLDFAAYIDTTWGDPHQFQLDIL